MFDIIVILLSSGVSGFLSGLAGSPKGEKHLRRYAIPSIVGIGVYLLTGEFLYSLASIPLVIAYSMGHGVPSKDDSGSSLGKFWANIFVDKLKLINSFVRATKGLIKGLGFILLGVIAGSWAICITAIILLITSNVLFGGDSIIKNEPMIGWMNSEEFIIAFLDVLILLGSVSLI